MKNIKLLALSISVGLLIGCTASAPKKAAEQTQTTANADEPVTPNKTEQQAPAPASSNVASANDQIAPPSAIAQLQGQITALQEQIIKLASDSAASLKINQLLLAKAQVQAVTNTDSESDFQGQANVSEEVASDTQLQEVLTKLDSIAPSPIGTYGIVSSYTARKQWVLIRFDRQTGETWLANSSGWNALGEPSELAVSQYDVHLIRADQDSKGYVASRIDQRTGDTWWLNKDRWVVYK